MSQYLRRTCCAAISTRLLSLTHRRHFSKRIWARAAARPGQPLRARFPTFELSNLVLDLDAETSKHVRPFDERDLTEQAERWTRVKGLDAVKEKAEEIQALIEEQRRLMQSVIRDEGQRWKLSDVDILEVALRGGTDVKSNLQSASGNASKRTLTRQDTVELLRRNGVPEASLTGDAKHVSHFMLHRRRRYAGELGQANAEAALRRSLEACETFEQAISILGRVMRKSVDIDLLLSQKSAVGPLLLELFEASDVPRQDLLRCLNDLEIGFKQHEKANRWLVALGIELAASAGHVPSLIRYLGKRASMRRVPLEMGVLEHGLTVLNQTSLYRSCEEQSLRSQLLMVLTAATRSSESAKHSVRSLISSTSDYIVPYLEYLKLLGSLGAFRTLWHEHQNREHWPKRDREKIREAAANAVTRAPRELHSLKKAIALSEAGDASERSSDKASRARADDLRLDLQDILAIEARCMDEDDCKLTWPEIIRPLTAEQQTIILAALDEPNIDIAMEKLAYVLINMQNEPA